MTKDIEKKHQQKFAELLTERRRLLSMPAEQALDEILDSPEALPLVHSFSEEDFFFLINDIGLDDALPILSMASSNQWDYILDVEIWERDRINLKPALKWFDLLLQADSDRFIQWLHEEKLEFFEFCLYKTIEVRKREHDEDPSDFGDDFYTLDGTFYIRLVNHPFNGSSDTSMDKDKEDVITTLLKRLADADYNLFQGILHEFASMIPSEIEEELYRLRNIRMAEKGFLPFDEAIGIYQPFNMTSGMGIPKRAVSPWDSQKSTIPLSLYPGTVLEEDNLFSIAVKKIDSQDLYLDIESEFAALCNQIISADHKIIREREELGEIVTKACGYLSIGLQNLAERSEKLSPEHIISLLSEYSLSHIFKAGYSLVLELKWRAERWQRKSWIRENGLPLGFWGEEWLGVLGGLLLKRPLYFDNYETGKLYREFKSLADIESVESILSEIINFDTLFSLMSIKFGPVSGHFITYKNSLLTFWMRNRLRLENKLLPVDIEQFRSFFRKIFHVTQESVTKDTQGIVQRVQRITTNAKTTFVEWISDETGLACVEITNRYSSIFENLFKEIENEYEGVSVKDLDRRYVHLFLVQKNSVNHYLERGS